MLPDFAAGVFLAAVPAAVLMGGLIWVWRSDYSLPQAGLLLGAVFLTRLLWRAQIYGRLPIGDDEGGVIVANHRSSIDPFFIQVIAGRRVHWMVAREYCQHPAFAWFLRTCEVIPVGRGGVDTAATKQALRYANSGGLVGMLPEGRINMTDRLMIPVRPGAALIAIRAGVPLIPCYIEGSPYRGTAWSPLLMTARVKVRIGAPIYAPKTVDAKQDVPPPVSANRDEPEDVDAPAISRDTNRADERRAAILILAAMREVARLANQPDFEPVLAGRQWKPTDEELQQLIAEQSARR